jgi:hypothetical protein
LKLAQQELSLLLEQHLALRPLLQVFVLQQVQLQELLD